MVQKKRALMFAINYVKTPDAMLRGCINDQENMIEWLKERGWTPKEIKGFKDTDLFDRTTVRGILEEIQKLVNESWSEGLDFVMITYSGHGTSTMDYSGDELDGRDEAWVPSDFRLSGLITDDLLSRITKNFNPKTKVVLISDSCHSGTILDMQYQLQENGTIKNKPQYAGTRAKIISLSGCRDDQTSADAFDNEDYEFSGAMTRSFIDAWDSCQNNVFALVSKMKQLLRQRRMSQVPQVCSTYDIRRDPKVMM